MSPITRTIVLLTLSNVFMTFAWYAHLRDLSTKPWYIAALASWGIALFEYLLQVITLTVFVPFVVFYMRQPLKWDYLWAALCMMGAVYFMFRKA